MNNSEVDWKQSRGPRATLAQALWGRNWPSVWVHRTPQPEDEGPFSMPGAQEYQPLQRWHSDPTRGPFPTPFLPSSASKPNAVLSPGSSLSPPPSVVHGHGACPPAVYNAPQRNVSTVHSVSIANIIYSSSNIFKLVIKYPPPPQIGGPSVPYWELFRGTGSRRVAYGASLRAQCYCCTS